MGRRQQLYLQFTAAVLSAVSGPFQIDVTEDCNSQEFELSSFMARRSDCLVPRLESPLPLSFLPLMRSIDMCLRHTAFMTPPTDENQFGKFVLQEFIIAQFNRREDPTSKPLPSPQRYPEVSTIFKHLWNRVSSPQHLDMLERNLASLSMRKAMVFSFLLSDVINKLYPSVPQSRIIQAVFPKYYYPDVTLSRVKSTGPQMLYNAIEKGQNSVVKNILKETPFLGTLIDPTTNLTPMKLAVCSGNAEAQRELNRWGIESLKNPHQELKASEIIHAVRYGNFALFRQWVVANRSNINTRQDNILALTVKQNKNLLQAVEILLANGADPNFVMSNEDTPLKMITKRYNRSASSDALRDTVSLMKFHRPEDIHQPPSSTFNPKHRDKGIQGAKGKRSILYPKEKRLSTLSGPKKREVEESIYR